MEKFIDIEKEHDYIGKKALLRQKKYGVRRRIKGVIFGGPKIPTITRPLQLFDTVKGKIIGQLTSGAYSPRFKKNIGVGMIDIGYWEEDKEIEVKVDETKVCQGLIKNLPLVG